MSRPTKVSTSRRSSSASRIPRLSSADNQRLNPISCFRRSNSSSNIQSKWSSSKITPISAGSRLSRTPLFSPFAMFSTKSINKEQWIIDAFDEIRQFVQEKDPEIDSLNPPTLNSFIKVMNLLFEALDSRSVPITKENYKEKIILELKFYNYPVVVSQSFLKTVNTKHNWPQVLSIWSWLIQLIKFVKNPRREDINIGNSNAEYIQLRDLTHNVWENSFKFWNKSIDDSEVWHQFKTDLVKMKGLLPKESLDKLENENKSLRETCQKLSSKNDEISNEIKNYETKNKIYLKETQTYNEKMETASKKLENAETALKQKIKLYDELIQTKISVIERLQEKNSNTHTFDDAKKLMSSVDILNHNKKLKQERKEHTLNQIELLDADIIAKKKHLDTLIHYKNMALKKYIINESLNDLILPQCTASSSADIELFAEKINEIVKTQTAIKNKKQLEIDEINNYNIEIERKMLKLEKEQESLLQKSDGLKKQKEEEETNHINFLALHENKIRELLQSIENANYEKLTSLIEEYQTLVQRSKNLKLTLEDKKVEAKEFISEIVEEVEKCCTISQENLNESVEIIEELKTKQEKIINIEY